KGWAFRDPERVRPGTSLDDLDEFESTDPINGFRYLGEAYYATDPNFAERVTVPVLWDKVTKRIVNNSEDDICPMFNAVFNDFARNKDLDFSPNEIQPQHTKLSDFLYNNVNNGVYRAGFAPRQPPYERACGRLFDALDELEERLSKTRYLFAD